MISRARSLRRLSAGNFLLALALIACAVEEEQVSASDDAEPYRRQAVELAAQDGETPAADAEQSPSGNANANSRGARMPLEEVVARSALVCRAKAVKIDPAAYDEQQRESFTAVTFEVLEVLADSTKGVATARQFTLYVRGGLTPDGLIKSYSHVPVFAQDESYLLFLRSGSYRLSPLANRSDSLLREIEVDGVPIYVNEAGQPLHSIDENGSHFTGTRVADPVDFVRAHQMEPDVRLAATPVDATARNAALESALRREQVLAAVRTAVAPPRAVNQTGQLLQLKPDPLELVLAPDTHQP